MLSVKPFTNDIINDIVNKPFYFLDGDLLNICNTIHPDDLGFFEKYYGDYYTEIVYYEYDRPVCPKCGNSMNSNRQSQFIMINFRILRSSFSKQ